MFEIKVKIISFISTRKLFLQHNDTKWFQLCVFLVLHFSKEKYVGVMQDKGHNAANLSIITIISHCNHANKSHKNEKKLLINN